MKKLMLMLVVLVFVGSAFAQPAGPYRLAFITSTDLGVPAAWNVAVDLSLADAHIQSLADNAGIGTGGYIVDPITGAPVDVTWHIIGSTTYVDARDHTDTNPNVKAGVPIYLVDQTTMVAANNADLWDWSLLATIGQDENGNAKGHWPHTGTYPDGTKSDGSKSGIYGPTHGGPMDTGSIAQGNGTSTTDWVWRMWTARPPSEALPVYGLSDIIPEPATMCLLGLGGLLLRRKR